MRRWRVICGLVLGCAGALPGAGLAQEADAPPPATTQTVTSPQVPSQLPNSSILTLASDRLFADSEFGRRVIRDLEAQSSVLAAENRRIEAELVLEEQELTRLRGEMSADEFRGLADAFDEKVQAIRREQEAKARSVNERRDIGRLRFFDAVEPVLAQIMQDTGASVILERSTVLMSANAADITDLAITRINATLGDGTQVPDP